MLSQNIIDLVASAATFGLTTHAVMKSCELCVWLAIRDELAPEMTNAPDPQQVSESKALAERPIGVGRESVLRRLPDQTSRSAFAVDIT